MAAEDPERPHLTPKAALSWPLLTRLPAELAARAVLLGRAPSDVVTANRTSVADGDRVIPLAGIWRTERFDEVCTVLTRFANLRTSRVHLQPPEGSTQQVRFKQCATF